jgi:hypothetical protein
VLVQASVEAGKKAIENEKLKLWLNMTEADLACLTINRPARVGALYQKVIQESNNLNFDSAKRQLLIYEQLNVQSENVKAGLAAFNNAKVFEAEINQHYLLFTGHMIDEPGRAEPRFSPGKESSVRKAIKEAVAKETAKLKKGGIKGIAGGACGSDILFHEVCEELGIETELYLVLPRELFIGKSVKFAGPQWIERFDALYKKLPRRVLSQSEELPKWLQKKQDYSIWERSNLWMLNSCLVTGGINVTLIAVWDGKRNEQSETGHMVKETEKKDVKIIPIDITTIV